MTIMQQVGRQVAEIEASKRADEYVSLARFILCTRGDKITAVKMAESAPGTSPRVIRILKNAVTAGSTSDGGLVEEQPIRDAFLESLRNASAFDRILANSDFRVVPLRTQVGVVSAGASGAQVAEAVPAAATKLELTGNVLDPVKAVAYLAVTNELARLASPAANAFIGNELRRAVGAATDAAFIALMIAGASSTASAGTTAAQSWANIGVLFDNVNLSANSKPWILTTPAVCKKYAARTTTTGERAFPDLTPLGGAMAGVPTLASDGVPAGDMILVDADQVAANSDTIELDSSTDAALRLDTSTSVFAGGDTITSLWQHDMTGLRATRFFGAEKLRSTAAYLITSVA